MSQLGQIINTNTGMVMSLISDAGTAHPVLGAITIAGGNNIGTSAAGSTLTINLDGTTNHAIQLGNVGGSLTSLGIGTTGTILQGVSGADPNWSTATYPSTVVKGDVLVASANNVVGVVNDVVNAGYILTANAAAAPTFQAPPAGVTYASDPETIAGTVTNKAVAPTNLKAKLGLQTQYALPVGASDTAAIGWLAVGLNGQTLMGNTAANPGWTSSPQFGGSVTATNDITSTAGSINSLAGSIITRDATNAATGPSLYFQKSRIAAAITSGDSLGMQRFTGYDGTGFITGAKITSTNSGTVGTNRIAGNLQFFTHPDSVIALPSEPLNRMTIASTGAVTIATPDSGTGLTVSGGGITCTSGAIAASSGAVSASTTVTAGTNLISTAGNLNLPSSNAAFTTGTININGTHVFSLGTATSNLLVGYDAGQAGNTTHTKNTFIGYQAGSFTNTSDPTNGGGSENVAVGYYAMGAGPVGDHNSNLSGSTAVGAYALQNVGWNNPPEVAIGWKAGFSLSANHCGYNTLVGYNAFASAVGTDAGNYCDQNTIMGYAVADAITNAAAGGVRYNTFLGSTSATNITTGSILGNVFVGYGTGDAMTTGDIQYNTFVGYQAGHSYPATSIPTYCINIGYGVSGSATEDHITRVGAATQTKFYAGGIYGVTPGGTQNIALVDSNGQLGSVATLPPSMGGALTWSIKTSDLNPMVVDSGYIANKAGLLTFTLPTTCAVGKVMRVTGMNTAVGARIAQSANQLIHFGISTTTLGAGGYIESTNIHDSVELVCCVTDLEFIVVSSTGNWTIV